MDRTEQAEATLSSAPVWHGSAANWEQLRQAVQAHCTCGDERVVCGAHRMLADQRLLDHLAYAYSLRASFWESEMLVGAQTAPKEPLGGESAERKQAVDKAERLIRENPAAVSVAPQAPVGVVATAPDRVANVIHLRLATHDDGEAVWPPIATAFLLIGFLLLLLLATPGLEMLDVN